MIENKSGITFTILSNEWLNLKKRSIKYTSFIKYKTIIDVHLLKLYDQKPLENWSEYDYYKLFEQYGKNTLTGSTLRTIKYVLKDILSYGEEIYNLKPVKLTRIKISSNSKSIEVLNELQRRDLIMNCQKNYNSVNAAVLLGLQAGLRLGEVCGLKWNDLNFERKTITISRTVQRIKNTDSFPKTRLIELPPKTASSKRVVIMTESLSSYLRNYINFYNPDSSETYILSNSYKMTDPRTIQRKFKKICKLEGMNINFHVLRHTFATVCVKYGVDIKVLSEMLGHSNISTTLNLYVHPTLDQKAEEMKKIDL